MKHAERYLQEREVCWFSCQTKCGRKKMAAASVPEQAGNRGCNNDAGSEAQHQKDTLT